MTTVGDEVWSDAQEMADIEVDTVRTRRAIEEIEGGDVDGRSTQATEHVPGISEDKEYSKELSSEGKKSAESIVIDRPSSDMADPHESHRRDAGAGVSPPGTATASSAPSLVSGRSTQDHVQTLEVPASASVVHPSPALSHHSLTSLERQSSRRRSTVDVRSSPLLFLILSFPSC